ncbi:TPA: UDP-N-acetylmuramate--L-alanine ligase, partial [Candidatus Marinimicrobia bacterium]|nr:MAG: UDP-N-acetylmuramate--L-alanine ligase [Marinimicrobia bacterium 46_47]KUK93857.1 MAG: UDP-N-acetylmuramate--L-alanine ligase [Marinimicrobia bacterium 46_43]HAE86540.1 UDP-N-acetylmuramate--L-alanine ligase [Candidatus Neomarinimicrobiota bacterium]HBY18658.1 UDP-N-acetylmuramate--L-alanine ligase [Candidatus Neomarinimicrobiota bacterium]
MKTLFGHIERIHIIGIGGIGMSSIAEYLVSQGFKISGSDASASPITARLKEKGIDVYTGHSAQNIHNAQLLVHSSAVPKDNPEIQEAKKRHLPVIKRPALLREILKMNHFSVGVAGTHGKTSTSSMFVSVLTQATLDPTAIIGGIDKGSHSNSRIGKSPWLVIEADEYDRTFLSLEPAMGIVTSIDSDHLDIYRDLQDIREAFLQYCNAIPFWGMLTVCLDNPNIRKILPAITAPHVTYGFHENADFRMDHYAFHGGQSRFSLTYRGKKYGPFSVPVPGRHFAQNAAAVASLAIWIGIDEEDIRGGLAAYQGVERRFELKGIIGGVPFIDDYAHHPEEIRQTLKAVRDQWPDRKILAIFQPHLFSRTRDFAEDFGKALSDGDYVVITGIYPAREKPIPGVSGRLISNLVRKPVKYIEDIQKLKDEIVDILKPNMVVIAMGAGNITTYFEKMVNQLDKEYS